MNSALILPCDTQSVSDGFHTFEELYTHRHMLWMLVLKHYKDSAFKTYRDENGVRMEGYFIAGLNTEYGQLTYHIPDIYWSYLDIPEIPKNEGYDNHTSKDVLDRLSTLINV